MCEYNDHDYDNENGLTFHEFYMEYKAGWDYYLENSEISEPDNPEDTKEVMEAWQQGYNCCKKYAQVLGLQQMRGFRRT